MEENRPLSSQQFGAMIFLLITGSALVYVPGNVAKQSAWIATILGSMAGLFVLYAVLKLHDMFPGLRITQISVKVLGKVAGTLLNILFYWSIFTFISSVIYEIIMLLTIIYPLVPEAILSFVIIGTCTYCLYLGINIAGRLGELSVGISLFFIILGIIIALPLVDLSRLKPLVEAVKPLVAGSIYSADWPFDEMVIVGLFLPLVSSIKENSRKIYGWYLASVLVLVILIAQTLSILGPEITQTSRFPLFEIYRLVGFGEFRRLELTFLVFWLISGIIPIIVLYQGMNYIMQDIINLKDHRVLIIPTGLFIMVLTLYMYPSDISYYVLGFRYIPTYTFPVNLLYPAIILLVALIRYKKLKSIPESAPGSPARPRLPETGSRY